MAGNATVSNGGFYNNSAVSPGFAGGLGEGTTAGPAFGGGIYQASGTLDLTGTWVGTNIAQGGSDTYRNEYTASAYGGGLFTAGFLNATNCHFYGNYSIGGSNGFVGADAFGGGIYNQNIANLIDTTISGNEAIGGVGGSGLFDVGLPSGAGNGGGIFNSNSLILWGCTISGNAAVGRANRLSENGAASEGGADAFGGGLYNVGLLLATNDTVYGNFANGGSPVSGAPGGSANGGGIFNQGGAVTLAYVTISSNSAVGGLGTPEGLGIGGGINATNGSMLLMDSIVADNPSGSDFYGTFGALTDGGDNISSDSSFLFSAAGSLNNTDPKLGLLGNYGGPTQTVSLLPNSPAIDAGGAGGCAGTDQRGFPRPFGGACDIGAFEYAPTFSIQGQIQSSGSTGVITVSAGEWFTVADNLGNYILNNVDPGTYQVIPSSSIPGVIFTPVAITVSVGPIATNVNFVATVPNNLTVSGYSNSVLELGVGGPSGQTVVVEASSNLFDWIPITTNTIGTNGVVPFLLTNSFSLPAQFVRIR
jgi:hypothetical protein